MIPLPNPVQVDDRVTTVGAGEGLTLVSWLFCILALTTPVLDAAPEQPTDLDPLFHGITSKDASESREISQLSDALDYTGNQGFSCSLIACL
jgi:hypothetical protein